MLAILFFNHPIISGMSFWIFWHAWNPTLFMNQTRLLTQTEEAYQVTDVMFALATKSSQYYKYKYYLPHNNCALEL